MHKALVQHVHCVSHMAPKEHYDTLVLWLCCIVIAFSVDAKDCRPPETTDAAIGVMCMLLRLWGICMTAADGCCVLRLCNPYAEPYPRKDRWAVMSKLLAGNTKNELPFLH